jgi:uncharacterized protein (TIGR02611 family)
MRKTYNFVRKVLVLCLGVIVFALGIIFLIIPGPGLLICLLGLFILSLEFPLAKRALEALKARVDKFRQARG